MTLSRSQREQRLATVVGPDAKASVYLREKDQTHIYKVSCLLCRPWFTKQPRAVFAIAKWVVHLREDHPSAAQVEFRATSGVTAESVAAAADEQARTGQRVS